MKKNLIIFILITVIPIQICGIWLMALGAKIISGISTTDDFGTLHEMTKAIRMQPLLVTIIVLGAIIFLTSFFGCFGAIRESYCISMTYPILLFALMLAQLVLIPYMWVQKDKFLTNMYDIMEVDWNRSLLRNPHHMDALQSSLECCGRVNFTDYSYQGYFPASCCKEGPCGLEKVYKVGCKEAIADFWDKNFDSLKCPILIMAAIKFVAFIFAGRLAYWR